MANCIAYEAIHVGGTTAAGPRLVGPDTRTKVRNRFSGGHVAAAIFYVDPGGSAPVRWRPDDQDPTPEDGGPIWPGGQVLVAGEGEIFQSTFITTDGSDTVIHAYYFDRVDVVGFDCRGASLYERRTHEILSEVLKITKELCIEVRRLRQGSVANGLVQEIEIPIPY